MIGPTPHRDYTFLGLTQSLCPDCLAVVPAKIVTYGSRVYFRKTCPTHGLREDFICSDVKWYDRMEYSLPAKLPKQVGVDAKQGCPLDCGLCTEHEQHTCVGLVEVTSSCNLTCPMCYASSAPGGKHTSVDDCKLAIDRLVAVEGRADVCQLSGGEPTIHPELETIVDYALAQPIDYVMINTNGIRFASDPALVEFIRQRRERMEIYFQLDGLNDEIALKLRGEKLLERKIKALDALEAAGIHVTLVATLQAGVNDDQIGALVQFGLERKNVTGISFQPATYSGRHVLPEELEKRITFPDVIKAVAKQTGGMFTEEDFLPLPCAHPNCHQVAFAYRSEQKTLPVTRFIDAKSNLDLLANGISFTREKSKQLLMTYLSRQSCCEGGDCTAEPEESQPQLMQLSSAMLPSPAISLSMAMPEAQPMSDDERIAGEFFGGILAGKLGARDLFRITITSFLDAYNFDVRRVMKCCTHHVLPSGHVIPFCAYNVLYRPGYVSLPELTRVSQELQQIAREEEAARR